MGAAARFPEVSTRMTYAQTRGETDMPRRIHRVRAVDWLMMLLAVVSVGLLAWVWLHRRWPEIGRQVARY